MMITKLRVTSPVIQIMHRSLSRRLRQKRINAFASRFSEKQLFLTVLFSIQLNHSFKDSAGAVEQCIGPAPKSSAIPQGASTLSVLLHKFSASKITMKDGIQPKQQVSSKHSISHSEQHQFDGCISKDQRSIVR